MAFIFYRDCASRGTFGNLFYRRRDTNMVCTTREAVIRATQLDLRSSVDDFVHPHGHRNVYCLGKTSPQDSGVSGSQLVLVSIGT